MTGDRFVFRYWAALTRIGPPRPRTGGSTRLGQDSLSFSQRYTRRFFGRGPAVHDRLRGGQKAPNEPFAFSAHAMEHGDATAQARFEDAAERADVEPHGGPSDDRSLEGLAATLGVSVAHETLARALTHESYAEAHGVPDNEPLMALGDSVLGLVATETIYRNHPDLTTGELPTLRARMVNTRTLARIARGIGLGRYVRISAEEEAAGGRERASILADILEAVVGAVCADQGLDAAAKLVHRLFDPLVELAGAEQTTPANQSTDES
ncbi:ribonuclease III family protein [Streptomyces sp. NPDC048192]|uniref:ribonuclease III family protein n=1 Tax=Streptomyces sp. NPDC048192 TaxID=3365510 RepID=UPI003716115F